MNKRDFIKLIAIAMGSGFLSFRIFHGKTMNNFLIPSINSYAPPPLSIDKLGWAAFLKQWSDEIATITLTEMLCYGIHDGSDKILQSKGINFQKEIFKGGLKYPPETIEEQFTVNDRIEALTATLKNLVSSYSEREKNFYGKEYSYEMLFNDRQSFFSPTDNKKIEEVEYKIGKKLPESYKEFLLTSNGFLSLSGFILPIEQVNWLKVRDKETMETWWTEGDIPENSDTDKEYLSGYDRLVGAGGLLTRVHYLESCLQIGEAFDSMGQDSLWLLNPIIQQSANEWEAWNWYPGYPATYRYRSFKEQMEHRYRIDVAYARSELLQTKYRFDNGEFN